MVSVDVESPANRRILATARLKKRRERTATGRFLVEGAREVDRAFAAAISIFDVFLCPDCATPEASAAAARIAGSGLRVTTVSESAFGKLSMRQNPDGIVVAAGTWDPGVDVLDRDLVLVAEAIEKPGNLGAMLRTADATGAALLIADPTVDPFNPNVVRASQGALFSVPFAIVDAPGAVAWAEEHGPTFVATPDAVLDYWDADLSGALSIVIGSEHAGVSAVWREAGIPISIPMSGEADSLNASVSAALVLYEAVRQRRVRR